VRGTTGYCWSVLYGHGVRIVTSILKTLLLPLLFVLLDIIQLDVVALNSHFSENPLCQTSSAKEWMGRFSDKAIFDGVTSKPNLNQVCRCVVHESKGYLLGNIMKPTWHVTSSIVVIHNAKTIGNIHARPMRNIPITAIYS
jgi:hypothetical protein